MLARQPQQPLDDKPTPSHSLIHGGGGLPGRLARLRDIGRAPGASPRHRPGSRRCIQGPNSAKRPEGRGSWSDDFASFRLANGLENTWIYQAVATCVSAISALVRMPGVDANRLIVTGQSWGGYFCSTVMSIDDRVRVGIPMFGAGFSPRVATGPSVSKMSTEDGRIQRKAFEPEFTAYRKPVLWVTHPTDTPPDELEKSYRATPGPNTLCVTNLPGHVHPAAIGNGDRAGSSFADSHFRGTDPLATLSDRRSPPSNFASATANRRRRVSRTSSRRRNWTQSGMNGNGRRNGRRLKRTKSSPELPRAHRSRTLAVRRGWDMTVNEEGSERFGPSEPLYVQAEVR